MLDRDNIDEREDETESRMTAKNLTSNMEDYLEAILTLQEEQKVARVRDIARQLKVKMPSVTGAVTLTEKGRKIAEEITSRHQILYDFLTRVLLVDMEIAELDACRIEHAVSPQTMTKLKIFLADYVPNP